MKRLYQYKSGKALGADRLKFHIGKKSNRKLCVGIYEEDMWFYQSVMVPFVINDSD